MTALTHHPHTHIHTPHAHIHIHIPNYLHSVCEWAEAVLMSIPNGRDTVCTQQCLTLLATKYH